MENRYKLPKSAQIQYFRRIEAVSKFSQKNLALLFGIVPRSYRDWRRGKFAIPQNVIDVVEKQFHILFPTSKTAAFALWKESKIEASRCGGRATMKKYGGPGTPEGRRKGGKKGIQTLRDRGLIPQPKPFYKPSTQSEDLAEFVGILLGDGHIGKEQWSITVSAKVDREYSQYIVQLIQGLFHFNPSYRIRSDCNVIVISGSGIGAIQYFMSIGLLPGNKIKLQVNVPRWIKENPSYSITCLKGLMDTDGGIFIHKYVVHNKLYSYTKLCFSNRSIPLISFVYDTLAMLKLQPRLHMKSQTKRVWLYDQNKVNEYLHVVTTHNPRLLKNVGGVR